MRPIMDSIMRLGIDAREFERGKSTGIQRYLRNFLEVAVEERLDITFVLYGNQYTELDLKAPNLEWQSCHERLTLWWDQVTLARRLKNDAIDVFLSPYLKGPMGSPCPVVITIHDLMFFVLPEYQRERPFWHGWLLRWYGALAVRKARRIITDSECSRRDIERFYPSGANKIEVVPLGLAGHFRPPEDRARAHAVARRYGVAGDYFLYLGNFRPHKNVATLIEAYGRLSHERRAAASLLLAAGRQHGRQEIEATVRRLHLQGCVYFADSIPEEDLPSLYGAAQLFVFPSRYEGFGLPVLEAMACGAPVICSDRASLPEVAGDAAVYVDPDDAAALHAAIEALAGDAARRAELAAAGLARAQRFTRQASARRLLEVLESCLEPGGKAVKSTAQAR